MGLEFFDSAEAVGELLTEAVKEADARVVHWQAEVKPGDCFVTDSGDGFPVFGEVLEGYGEAWLQHCRLCRCYSVACPEGELGDVHVSTIVCRVSRGLFERLREQGWRL